MEANNTGVYSLKWNSFQTHLSNGFHKLLEDDDFTDVTLACGGNCLRSHKILLSMCSPFFKRIFKANRTENANTVVILNNVRFEDLHNIIKFIYNGQVNVKHIDLNNFLQAAELLQIEGLAGGASDEDRDDRNSSSNDVQQTNQANSSFIADKFHANCSNSNFNFANQLESPIPIDPTPAKRSKISTPTTSTKLQPILIDKSYQRGCGGFSVASNSEREISNIDNNEEEIVTIDPLNDDQAVHISDPKIIDIHDKNESIGIFPDVKIIEDEEPVFLESVPPDIRIEGVFSTSQSSSTANMPGPSSSVAQPKQGNKYSGKRNTIEKGYPRRHAIWNYCSYDATMNQSCCSLCGRKMNGMYSTNLMKHMKCHHRKEHDLILALRTSEKQNP